MKDYLLITFSLLLGGYVAGSVFAITDARPCVKKNLDYAFPARPMACWLNKER